MKKTSYKNLKKLFIELGVKSGRIVMIHGFIPSLGRIEGGYDTLFKVLFDIVGEGGGIIVPTFTYSFTRGEVFDVNNTKSTVGGFTNFFLTLDGCYRNLEPNFSMAGIGLNVSKIIYRDRNLTFGKGSIYERVEEEDVLFLLLGIGWDQGLSYFMHLEASYGVGYRYNKEFTGIVVDYNGNSFKEKVTHFVRDLSLNPVQYRTRLGNELEGNGKAKKVKFAYGIHKSIGALDLKKEVFNKLDKNKYYLLKEINNKEVKIDK